MAVVLRLDVQAAPQFCRLGADCNLCRAAERTI